MFPMLPTFPRNLSPQDFVGFRADDKFGMDREHYPEIDGHFAYDASIRDADEDSHGFAWPQTLHRELAFACKTRGGAAKCPTKAANLWAIPENTLVFQDAKNGSLRIKCRGLDNCDGPISPASDERNLIDLLNHSLERYAKT